MIVKQHPINIKLEYPCIDEYSFGNIIFFDIETTGFSADTTYLYLIGCVYYMEDSFHMLQWFSEGIEEEGLLLSSFFEFTKEYEGLVHYNGSSFDIPYLLRKCRLLKLDYSFDCMKSIDLYKKISPYKKILNLPNYKQKTLENYLNIQRKDPYDGGDLIQLYANYLGKHKYEKLRRPFEADNLDNTLSPSEELLHDLLLHNEEDLKGLLGICTLLPFIDIFEKPLHITQVYLQENHIDLTITLKALLPHKYSFENPTISFIAKDNKASIKIITYQGELKYFYENYKDYFFLPMEDMAVHKSLANYVDKGHRVPAKASTCYTKKDSVFAPQYEPLFTPSFKQNYQDKLQYFELTTDFLFQEENIARYTNHLLSHALAHM